MKEYELDQPTRLHLGGILAAGHPEAAEAETLNPWSPLSRAALSGKTVPRAPRHHWRDDDLGDASPELADGEEEEERTPRYGAHVLPSMRDRASIRAELRGMGIEW
jgi:hypothetical protein